ncbi:MAG: hypothetical protein QMD01_06565 [Thermodesulfovibrionales bacterium]|nr:hypothetical protein [Thermodesulfovibrionales bacterium]
MKRLYQRYLSADPSDIRGNFNITLCIQQHKQAFNNLIALIKTLKPCLPCLITDYGHNMRWQVKIIVML